MAFSEVNKDIVVIYHAHCTDGFAAAWAMWKVLGDTAHYHAGAYGESVPDILDKTVYLVDFSYKRDLMEIIVRYAKKVVLLDHHKSAIEGLSDLSNMFDIEEFDMTHATTEKSGAMIAFEYAQKVLREPIVKPLAMPHVFPHFQDYDLWKFELEHTREIMHAVRLRDMEFAEYDKLMKLTRREYNHLIEEGKLLKKAFDMNVESLISEMRRYMRFWEWDNIPVANIPGMYASEAGNIMSTGHPFSVTYYDKPAGRKFSLRSTTGVGEDVSLIAAKYGGGGHKHAAGFTVPFGHDLCKL